MLYLSAGRVITPEREIRDGAVIVHNGRIVAVGPREHVAPPAPARMIEAPGLILASGFSDLQLNGAFGADFTAEPATIWNVGAQLVRYGVTAFLPTLVSSPRETISAAQQVLRAGAPREYRGALPLGLHLEGPFLNPEKRGAHNPAYLKLPDLELARAWTPQDHVRLVTLAPELDGARELIRALCAGGVVVSAGHSTADYAQARAAIEAGVTYGTHLFNAMPPLDHRAPGLAAALLNDARVTTGVIADGIHVHPALIELSYRAKGAARTSLVSDAMAALGMPPGMYRLGDWMVKVDETSARLPDGRLAGSILSADQALRNLISMTGCGLGEALATLTTTPARVLKLEQEFGRIAPGQRADMILLTRELRVAATFVAGALVWSDDISFE